MSSSDRSRYLLDEGDVVVIERPTTEQFHLQGEHDQKDHGRRNAQGESIAEVGRTIPEERAADAVLEEWMSSPEEFAAAQALAAEKARNVPKPTAEQIEKNRKMLEKSKRPGGWGRGNSYTRRARGQALFEEFGGKPGGSCPCAHCGIKVSPRGEGGFAAMTQDKILTAAEGGTYGTVKKGFPNLIPACGGCNSSRNQASFDVRPEWDEPIAASAGATVSDRFVAQSATGKPVGWDTWLEDEVGDRQVTGEYIVRTVDVWFGPYEQHLIAGETCDPATIDVESTPEADLSLDRGIEVFHLQGQHNQADHGNRAAATIAPDVVARVRAGESITVSPSEVADVVAQFENQDGPMDLAAIDVEGYPNLFSGARANVTAREDMPQIPKAHLQRFREGLEAEGIAVEEVQLNATELSATQRQLVAVKVAGVADAIRNGEFKVDHRIWVSHDNRILDGHHRWAAAAVVELEGHPTSAPLDGYRVDLDMDALLVKARQYNDEHDIDARTYRAHMEALGLQTFHLQGQHDQQSHAGDVDADGMVDDYQVGHRPSETGPRIHDLLESEMTDGLDVYQNPHFFTGYAKAELDETMAQLRRVQGDPEAKVTIYRAAPEGAKIHEGDWVSLSKTYADLHAESNLPDGVTPTVLEMEVPAKSVRWSVDDLMEYGYFPDLADKRIFSENDLAVAMFTFSGLDVDEFGISTTFHLQGQHDQKDHGRRGRAADPRPRSGDWQPLEAGIETDRFIEYDEYENQYRVTAANGQQIEARVYTWNPEVAAITRTPQWKQRIADALNGATDGYDMAPTDQPPHIIIQDEIPSGLPPEAEEAIAFVAVNGAPGPVPNGAPFHASQLRQNGITINASPRGREMWDLMEERGRDIMMPSISRTSVARYTGVHEYGHTRAMDDGLAFLDEMYNNIRPLSLSSISPEWKALSRYGKTNPAEAHAETFADWVLTGGRSENAATRHYAEWVFDRAEVLEPLAAAAGATKLSHQWVYCFDGPNGGILVTKASDGVQFHLQGQHDQKTHGNRGGAGGGLPDEFAEVPPGYIESAQAEWAAGAAYLAENEMPDWWAGLDYIGEDGLPVGENGVGTNYEAEDIIERMEKFREEVGPEVDAGISMIGRAAEERRREEISRVISMNELGLDEASERYGRRAEADRGEWQDLPPTLYHATSALGAISADGALKTRREIGGRDSAAGLGGGTDNTISFTSDRKIAEGIARSLHEVHRALNLPKDQFISELKERSGDWWTDVEEMDRSVNGASSWETTEERFNLYRIFAGERERRDGVLDPLFFGVNPNTLRDMNPADIGIVEVAPAVTGAKGYQVSALGEWRTPTGAATEITRYIETEPVDQFTLTTTDLAVEVLHLQGQHDQKDHGRRGGATGDDWEDTRSHSDGTEREERAARIYSGTLEVDGNSYQIQLDSTRADNAGVVKLEGRIIDPTRRPRWQGDQLSGEVGKFQRTITPGGTLKNDVFIVNEEYRRKGIGSAFLDQTEAALREEFDLKAIEVAAVEDGRYAWAARGYGTSSDAVETWMVQANRAVSQGALGGDTVKKAQFDALMKDWKYRWENVDFVYPADLIALSPAFRDSVFLAEDSPDWRGVMIFDDDQIGRGKQRVARLATEVFHLQGQHDQKDHGRRGGRSQGEFEPITAAEKRGNSRPVTADEFQRLAAIGQEQIDELAADTQPIGLDENWSEIQQDAFNAAQESWGGATINARTGEFLASDADLYALTVKESGMETVTVPENASQAEFEAAMTAARDKFRPVLERRDHYLGVFHDDDLNRIDFDPVTVVDSLDKVETIGAATRAIGGAYNFADGNGYWPPHVDEDAVVASASMGSMGDEITRFKGPAEWKRQAKQLEGAPDAPPAPKKTRKFRVARD